MTDALVVPDGKDPLLHRAEMTAKYAERAFDMLRTAWSCSSCASEVPPPAAMIQPVAPYRTVAQAGEQVGAATKRAMSLGAGQEPCPKCGAPSQLVSADLHLFCSAISADLVARHAPGRAAEFFRWSVATGFQPTQPTIDLDRAVARDALLRTIAAQKDDGDDAQGLATLGEAAAAIPGDLALLKFLPWVHRLGAFDLSRAIATAHVAAHPDDAEGHFWLAQATVEEVSVERRPKSALDEAVTSLERANGLNPDYPAALLALANVARLRARDDEAEKALRALLAKHPEHPEANYTLGLVLLAKSPADALACFERGERVAPNDADYPRSRARALAALGRTDEARAAILRAKTLAPGDPRVDQVAASMSAPPARAASLGTIIRVAVGLLLLAILGVVVWVVVQAVRPAPPPPRPRRTPQRAAPTAGPRRH